MEHVDIRQHQYMCHSPRPLSLSLMPLVLVGVMRRMHLYFIRNRLSIMITNGSSLRGLRVCDINSQDMERVAWNDGTYHASCHPQRVCECLSPSPAGQLPILTAGERNVLSPTWTARRARGETSFRHLFAGRLCAVKSEEKVSN